MSITSISGSPSLQSISTEIWDITWVSELSEEWLADLIGSDGVIHWPSPYTVVALRQGGTLPVNLKVSGNLFDLALEGGPIVVKQNLYLRVLNDEILVSTNLQNWHALEEAFHGDVAAFVCKEGGEPKVSLTAELNFDPSQRV
jgi:hypothetical protein